MERFTVIQEIIDKKNAQTYLEIGVWGGICFNLIKCPIKIAVDPKILIEERNPDNYYFEMTSNKFFRKKRNFLKKNLLDVVFIDGLHTYRQALKDVKNSLKYLNEGGVIVIHDCNPPSQSAAIPVKSLNDLKKLKLPKNGNIWCGDVWKTIVHLRSKRKELIVFVLNCDFGIGIVTRGKPYNKLNYNLKKIKNLNYKDLATKRMKLINLKNPEYLKEFLSTL